MILTPTVIADTSPTPSPTPICLHPSAEVLVLNPVAPNFSDSTMDAEPYTVRVRVTVQPDGKPSNFEIIESSNNKRFDQAVIRAAAASSYAPQYVDCVPVVGTYIFRAVFKP